MEQLYYPHARATEAVGFEFRVRLGIFFPLVAFNNLNRFYGRPFLPKAAPAKGKKPKVKRGSAKSKAKAKAKSEPAPKRAKN